MDIRDVIADLVFVIRAPVDGVEEAMNEAAGLSAAWRGLAMVMRALGNPWALPRSYRRELLSIANTYFSAGSDPSTTFLALYNKYNSILNQWIEWQGRALTAIVVIAVMLGVLSFAVILGAPPAASVIGLALIPMIHYFQVNLVRYDYLRPGVAGVIAGASAYVIGQYVLGLGVGRLALVVATAFGAGFAALYMPQFIAFIRNYLGLGQRVLGSFGELLTVPNPRPPRPATIVERELRPLWEYAYSVGVREFIERVGMAVDSLITFVRRSVATGFVYGPFTAVGYAFLVFTAYVLHGVGAAPMIYAPIDISPGSVVAALMPLSITTALIVGKSMHSIGLGISLIPLFLAPLIPLVW